MLPYCELSHIKTADYKPKPNKELDYFLENAFHDLHFLLEATTSDSSSVFTYFGDLKKQLFYISDNMRDIFGFEHNVVDSLLVKWKDRIYGDKWVELYERDLRNILSTKSDVHSLRYQVKDIKGNVFWIHCYGRVLWNKDRSEPLFFAGRLLKQSDEFAVDPLTNFPVGLVLRSRLSTLKEYGYSCTTIGIGLNHIPQINIMHGRMVGDRIIRKIAQTLTKNLVGKMSFYCVSGTRFIALVDNEVKESKESLIKQIRQICENIYEGVDIKVDRPCSFAVMDFSAENDQVESFIENMISLIRYSNLEPGLEYVDNSDKYISKITEAANMNLSVSHDVLNGMNNFRLVIQPIVSTETEKIVGGEVLLRWRYQGEEIAPSVFIPTMEKNRLISIAGRWIMENAVLMCSKIVKIKPDFYLTINISRRQLFDEELFLAIPEILHKYDVEGKNLVFEITESTIDKEPKRTRQLIDICNYYGIRLAIDDFGTGYSSFQSLMSYKYNILKIDRTLLLEMEKSKHNLIFVSGLANACHKSNIKLCMEGVETDEQKSIANDIPCDMIQGYYYFKPIHYKDFLNIIEEHYKQ